jgi:N-acyl-phosphatidylethanolamine-hydrolysing phospholipase D
MRRALTTSLGTLRRGLASASAAAAPTGAPALSAAAAATAAAAAVAAPAEHILHDARGRRTFRNPPSWGSYTDHSPLDFLTQALPQWRWGTRGYELPAANSAAAVAAMHAPTSPLQARWIGHVTFLLQAGGLNVLTDPMFSEYASPVQGLGPARYTPVPATCTLAALPPIDLVLLSHSHYDHLDRGSVRALLARWGSAITWVVPLGLEEELCAMGVARSCVRVLDWWGQARVECSRGAAAAVVTCVPAQHQSARGLLDRNTSLWAGFVLQAGGRSVYFAGDTGYRTRPGPPCPAFRSIGQRFGGIDLALLPIGAYSPESFMGSFHANPEDAVEMCLDVRARAALGMHWGTFLLTDEPIEEPPARLQAAVAAQGLPPNMFRAIRHGEMWQEGGALL